MSITQIPNSDKSPCWHIINGWQNDLAAFSKQKGYFRCEVADEQPRWSNGMVLDELKQDDPVFLQKCLEQILDASARFIDVFGSSPVKIFGRTVVFAFMPQALGIENPYFRILPMYAAAHGENISLKGDREITEPVPPLYDTEFFGWNSRMDNAWGNCTYNDHHLCLHVLIHKHPYFTKYDFNKRRNTTL